MVRWHDVADEAPELAAAVRAAFSARRHATLATVRRDGAPRISGTEVTFEDSSGQLVLGSMPAARKAMDLRRDPRLALHSPTVDPPADDPGAWAGEAKIGGRAIETTDPRRLDLPHRFVVDVTEVVLTTVGDPADHLVIHAWHADRGTSRHVRR